MQGKTAIVTGANSGMGMATVKALSDMGITVVMLCRSEERGRKAYDQLMKNKERKLDLMLCDLGNLASIRDFVSLVKEKYEKIDILVNNAGFISLDRQETKDGFERQFGVNHIGHFMLTTGLLDIMGKGSKIVNVASGAHKTGKIHFDDINLHKGFNVIKAYSQSKLANVLFTRELSRRLADKGITVNCCHPGAVATNIGIDRDTGFGKKVTGVLKPVFQTPEQGAATAIYLATSDEVSNITGGYFYKCKPVKSSKQSKSRKLAAKLYRFTEKLIDEKGFSGSVYVPERVIDMRNAWEESDAKRDAGLTEPENMEKNKDIPYGPYGKWNLLDLYRPIDKKKEMLPVIVSIHGGGYFYGDKELYRFYTMHLAEYGFAVINFNYRLSPENKFPAPLEDTLAIFNWISRHAAEYGLDKSNVFMVGDSAGAQLVSQFACICSNDSYAETFRFKVPKDVELKGISLACGMYRIRDRIREEEDNEMMLDYFGSKSLVDDPRTEVLENITSAYPPAYVFSAENDFLRDECRPMAEYLATKGIRTEYKIYGTEEDKEIAHVFHCNMRLAEGESANKAQTDFFKSLIR
ncbi:MAG: SDR family NAD(P)-dependent oxidoreductase [Lachnospiraceae bacterium]|nr:SDR family NAD(P)-dependent oxidoreductase [Lachnospiraceae bacterium]